MINAAEGVRPCRRAAQRLVLHDGRMREQLLLAIFRFQAVVGAGPDALELADLAFAVACSAAGAIALVLGALRFGAQERDVRQRAVAAVPAAEHDRLRSLFEHAKGARTLGGIARSLVNRLAEAKHGRVR